jgi:hypothetical protein
MFKLKYTVAAVALALGASSLAAAERAPVSPSEVPQAVTKAVSERYPSGQGASFAKEVARGTTVYAVSLFVAGAPTALCVARSGDIQREQQAVSTAGLPDAVQTSLHASGFQSAQVVAAQRVTHFGSPAPQTYEIVVTLQGTRHELTFDGAGQLVTAVSSASCVGEPGAASDRVALRSPAATFRAPA